MPKVDLVLFGCEYRQYLLPRTHASFREKIEFNFNSTTVSWDGTLEPEALRGVDADYILQSTKRRGYVRSILRWLRFTDSDYFFWLEDDWTFNQQVDIERLVDLLDANEDWIQIRLSKRVLETEERQVELAPGIYRAEPIHGVTFSANPCLCKTDPVRRGFSQILDRAKDEETHEHYMTRWVHDNGWTCGVVDPGEKPGVEHQGYLEYTEGPTWHSAGLARGKKEEMSPSSKTVETPLMSRVVMIAKLLLRALTLSVQQLSSDKAYHLAQRIYHVDHKEK
ncbi:hypothetical protein GGP66_000224 [Salinibacter ruber]|uniref:hypothetical protein n=1 Tax=Salinibacter ruber TaxID=146919 RepID=UPI00216AB201|nr:hypothetical protein [Salinibacter ruber]MCS3672820.1 hypothetical protein [Salinibacter ruber]